VRPWFESDPGLLERELDALSEAGLSPRVDEAARARGTIRVHLVYAKDGHDLNLVATYPDLFPFFKPEVATTDLKLDRHQHPFGGTLCLVGRRTSAWFVEEPLASVIEQQLPELLAYAATGDLDALGEIEEEQGEPASDYYRSQSFPDAFLLIDSAWRIDPEVRQGTFEVLGEYIRRQEQPTLSFRGFVDRVLAPRNVELARWSGPRPGHFSTRLAGRWARVDEPVLGDLRAFEERLGPAEFDRLRQADARGRDHQLILGAVLYPEEVRHREFGDGWAFFGWDIPKMKKGRPRQGHAYFIASERAGKSDLAARNPQGTLLEAKGVAIIGLGAIGSPVALEMARAGVQSLRIVDADRMEPATLRRWALGWPAFGRTKVQALKERIEAEYPGTKVHEYAERLGAASDEPARLQSELIEEIMTGADLVIDVTAEMGVNHFVSELCRVRNIPLIVANATLGGWGGMVARFTVGRPCWMCLRRAFFVTQQLPLPIADETGSGELQPPGCGDPTFTGAGYDLSEVSLHVVRTAASMLVGEEVVEDLALLSLRRPDGSRIPPMWSSHMIPQDETCQCRMPA
jgi:molybdopterin/thiamine biosynthesis adenylyltransferase